MILSDELKRLIFSCCTAEADGELANELTWPLTWPSPCVLPQWCSDAGFSEAYPLDAALVRMPLIGPFFVVHSAGGPTLVSVELRIVAQEVWAQGLFEAPRCSIVDVGEFNVRLVEFLYTDWSPELVTWPALDALTTLVKLAGGWGTQAARVGIASLIGSPYVLDRDGYRWDTYAQVMSGR